MTSHRLPSPAGPFFTRTGIALLLLLATALAIAASAACGSTSTTVTDYIGTTDAAPPRLGSTPDGGTAR